MSDYKQPAISTIGVTHEKELALIDARDFVWERGDIVTFKNNNESAVTRDKMGSIKYRANTTEYELRAFPITYSPTDEQVQEAGLKERTDVIVYTAMKDWNDEGFTLQNLMQIDMIRWRIDLKGETYEMKSKGMNSQFYDTYLYVTFGLNKV